MERNRHGRVGRIPTPTPFPVGDINTYLILPQAGGEGLTLIDTGVRTPDAEAALRRGFKEFGHTLEQVQRILVTHAHPDHFGQARRIRDLSGAEILASPIEAERIRQGWTPRAAFRDRAREMFRRWGTPDALLTPQASGADRVQSLLEPVEVDGLLGEGDRVALGDWTLEVLETPGHCEGHIVFYERETRTLFSGDHLLTDISPVPLLHIPAEGEVRQPSLLRFLESLAKVEALECETTFPSHGSVIWNHRELIASYRLHHDKRKLQIAKRLRHGPLSPFAIASRMFKHYVRNELFLVMSEVIGHLDLLVEEGVVLLEERDGVEVVRLVSDVGQ